MLLPMLLIAMKIYRLPRWIVFRGPIAESSSASCLLDSIVAHVPISSYVLPCLPIYTNVVSFDDVQQEDTMSPARVLVPSYI